jgi:MFS transporter, NNP family, nitrate/nitrite transporter
VGARQVLVVSFAGAAVLAAVLALGYASIWPLTACCLSLAVMLGLGSGAVFKLVALEFPAQVGAVTGVVGAAGGLGGFFPPLVMASVWSLTGSYTLGFVLLSLTAALCLAVAAWPMRPVRPGVRTPARG